MFTDNYLPNIDGVSVSVHTLVEGLRANGLEVRVLAPSTLGDQSGAERLTSLPLPTYPKYRAALPAPRKAITRAAEGADLVHTHGLFSLILLGRYVARRRRVPLVHTHHTLLVTELAHAPLLPPVIARNYTRWYCNGCDGLIAPTVEVAAELVSYGVHRPIQVIPTGVDVELLRRGAQAPAQLPGVERVVTFSRLVPRKSVDKVIEAFALVRESRPRATLTVLGDGPSRPGLEALAGSLGLSEAVRFLGEIPRERVGAFLAPAHVFAFGSVTETQGLTVQEAMAVGVPAVAVAARGVISSIRDGETGFLVPPGDQVTFADRVTRLLSDPGLRQRMGAAAREQVDAEASPKAMARRIEAVYADALAARRAARAKPVQPSPPR